MLVSEKELSIEDVKRISMELLDEVHVFCEKNNLKYILFSGSLLGCIRHKGFIPWDDDIDIAMPREDYEIFSKTFRSKRCEFINYTTCSWYYLPWGKVADLGTLKIEPVHVKKDKYGVDIDIYPCDYIQNIKQGFRLKKKLKRLDSYRGHSVRLYDRNIIKNFFTIFFRGRHTKLCIKENEISSMHNDEIRNFIFRNCSFSSSNDIYPIDMFDNRLLMKFENREYFVPQKYDEILTSRYGNYKQMPKKNEQVPHHINKTYFI